MTLLVKNLHFGYDKSTPIVRGWSLEIEPGEVVGLSAPSGTGKSTFAKLLAGYLKPDSGSIYVDGEPLTLKGRCPVQLIIQNPESAVDPRWTAKAIISEGATGPLDQQLLKTFGVKTEWFTRTPNELSGGELQRLTIVRSLSGPTRYLIADELSTMLDANAQAQIWNALLAETKRRNIGLLSISHNSSLLEQICDRILGFEDLEA